MTKRYILSRKVFVGLFTLFAVLIGFVFLNKDVVLGYVCPIGTTCSSLGNITDGVYRPGCEVWNDDDSAPRCLQYGCTYSGRIVYACSGTDSECEGQSAAYYYTYENCMTRTDPRYSYCCSGGGGSGGESCGCGTQECESYDCECTYIGCKRISDPDANCYAYRCDTEPPCTDCSLGSCPAPLTDTGNAEYLLSNYRSCLRGGSCAGMKYGDCYENPNAFPSSDIDTYPVAGETTTLGCQSSTYSGTEINNPINMIATFDDADGASDIEAISVWLKTDTAIPNTPQYIDSSEGSTNAQTFTKNSWGFMMHKEGTSWIPYIPKLADEWVRASYSSNRFAIKGPGSNNMLYVEINSVNSAGNRVTLNFDLDFRNISDTDKVLNGNYNLFTMVNDIFGFTPYDNYPSTVTKIGDYFNDGQIRFYNSWVDSGENWYIDFTAPEFQSTSVVATTQTGLEFSAEANDEVNLYGFVSNVYASEGVEDMHDIQGVSLVRDPAVGTASTTSPYTLVNYNEELHGSGSLSAQSLAKIVNINVSGISTEVTVDIGANREQSLTYVATAFDQACNVASSSVTQDIEDWIVTYGGLMYSSGGVFFVAKDLAPEVDWNSIALLNRIPEIYSEITSEMYGNQRGDTKLLKEQTSTSSYAIGDFNAYRNIDFYKDIKTTFEKREVGLGPRVERIPSVPTLTGSLGGGAIKVMDRNGDLTVNSYTCNGKGLFFVSNNLIINDNILNSNVNSDACMFVVNGNVTINQGVNSSGGSLGYDEINAYILTNGNIYINSDTNFDGLYINGGIQSLGNDGIRMDRYLGVNYRTTHPALVVDHHSKYGLLSTVLLGNPVDVVKVEVGFKPF